MLMSPTTIIISNFTSSLLDASRFLKWNADRYNMHMLPLPPLLILPFRWSLSSSTYISLYRVPDKFQVLILLFSMKLPTYLIEYIPTYFPGHPFTRSRNSVFRWAKDKFVISTCFVLLGTIFYTLPLCIK